MKTKLMAATRLNASLLTEARVVLRSVVQYLRDNGHAASDCQGLVNAVMTNADFSDTVDTLDANRWTVVSEGVEDGCRTAIMRGDVFALRVKETAHKITIVNMTKI
jgi:hypothetical protein